MKRKAESIIKNQDFTRFKQFLLKQGPTEEMIEERDGHYIHSFALKLEDDFFENVEAHFLFGYSVNPHGQEVITTDCQVLSNGIHTDYNDGYFYTKYKSILKPIFQQAKVLQMQMERDGRHQFHSYNLIDQKRMNFELFLREPQFMDMEESYLLLMEEPNVKELNQRAQKKDNEEKETANSLLLQLEKSNWQREVDNALENRDFITLEKLVENAH